MVVERDSVNTTTGNQSARGTRGTCFHKMLSKKPITVAAMASRKAIKTMSHLGMGTPSGCEPRSRAHTVDCIFYSLFECPFLELVNLAQHLHFHQSAPIL